MTLLTICEGLAKNVGMAVPDVIVTSPDRSWAEALEMANEVGDEMARRFDWPQLFVDATLTGDGTDKTHTMPADFLRFPVGLSVRYSGAPVRSLTHGEFASLTMEDGKPRYFRASKSAIRLWPYLATADTADTFYISTNWANGAAEFMADDDTTVFDEDVFTKGLIVRWRRQKGMPYADEEAEYESALQDAANFAGAARF